jgi:anti-sigma regulatory factor (Ser/Thr protein kinase)
VFDTDEELVDRMTPYLRAGLQAGEPVIVVLAQRKCGALAEALGEDGAAVRFVDRDTFYTRPEAAMASYDAQVRSLHRGGSESIRVLGELPHCRTREEWEVWIAYEATLNPAFADRPVQIMCAYDTREVPAWVVREAHRTHPDIVGDPLPGYAYEAPDAVVRDFTRAPEPLAHLAELDLPAGTPELRDRLQEIMDHAEVPSSRADALLGAVGELVANAHLHGGGVRAVRTGTVGGQFVCELTDLGEGFDDPLAGHLPPRSCEPGAGLWVARQLSARLELLSAAEGLTARVWV